MKAILEKDIRGIEVQCFGESKEFGEAFFHLSSIIVGGFTIVLACLFIYDYQLKRNLK